MASIVFFELVKYNLSLMIFVIMVSNKSFFCYEGKKKAEWIIKTVFKMPLSASQKHIDHVPTFHTDKFGWLWSNGIFWLVFLKVQI